MKSIDNNAPIDVLRNFFFEMNQWESTFAPKVISLIENDAPQSEIDSTKAEAKKILIDIFDKFNITGKKIEIESMASILVTHLLMKKIQELLIKS
jgi:hypothetical protein